MPRIGAPFIFLTNGELIYFWDYQMMMPVLLAPSFHNRLGAFG